MSTFNESVTTGRRKTRTRISLLSLSSRVSCVCVCVYVVVMMMSSLAQTSSDISFDVENSKIFVTKSVSKNARDEEDDIDADKSLQILLVVPS